MRGGNWLYYWQHAYTRRQLGEPVLVRWLPGMDDWLNEFPMLSRMTIRDAEISRRDYIDRDIRFGFGRHFSRAENEAFCTALLQSFTFASRIHRLSEQVGERTCVLNVRRGDYYSDGKHFARYGIDAPHHFSEALTILSALGRRIDDIVIVSDDPQWCSENLSHLATMPMRTLDQRTGMFDDLAAVCLARTSILANSTFSYWGAHLASARLTDTVHIAPHHHETEGGEFDSRMFDPRWFRTGYRPPSMD